MSVPRIFPQRLSGRPGIAVRTPFSDPFILRIKAMVPRADRYWNQHSRTWWIAQPFQDVVEHIVREVFGAYELEDADGEIVTYTVAGEKLHQESLLL